MVYKRKGEKPDEEVLVILNMTPVPRYDFKVTVKHKKDWEEIFNSDAKKYGGTGDVYNPTVIVDAIDKDEKIYS
jgi:1,4-alpha-glucan branching enzyme